MKKYYSKKVIKNKIKKKAGIFFLSSEQEKNLNLAAADLLINKKKYLSYKKGKEIYIRKNQSFISEKINKINFINLETNQMTSLGTGLIPFLEHDDANRALMGSNMQRQAVAIENPEIPKIQTGIEKEIGKLSNSTIKANNTGKIEYVSTKKIIIKTIMNKYKRFITKSLKDKTCKNINKYKYKGKIKKFIYSIYPLILNRKSNQNTYLTQHPINSFNEYVKKGQIIADGNGTKNGKIALGKTLLIGYIGWEGYNFEDAIVISQRLVDEEVFTSYHIKKYKTFILNLENEEVCIEN